MDDASYARSYLPYATQGELSQFASILSGQLPRGFDPSVPGDWIASVGRIKAASDARARAAASRPWKLPSPAPAAPEPEFAPPAGDRAEAMRLVRLWMSAPYGAAGAVFFSPPRVPSA